MPPKRIESRKVPLSGMVVKDNRVLASPGRPGYDSRPMRAGWILGAALLAAGCLQAPRLLKGNTHTHTLWSDGDAAPETVVDWYRTRGYDFLVLSDHNILSEGEKWVRVGTTKDDRVRPETVEALERDYGPGWVAQRMRDGRTEMRLKTLAELRKRFEVPGSFLLITGEEITDKFENKPIHHNSVNQTGLIKPTGGTSVRDVMARTIEAVEAEGRRTGRPILVHLNHPNFGWAVTPEDVAHVAGERFFEVYNGHGGVNNYGDATRPGMEALWDFVLTLRLGTLGGPPLYGLAVDDAHNYGPKERPTAPPGRGWIWVNAERLESDAVTRAILNGDFHASSGVKLRETSRDGSSLTIKVAAEPGVSYVIRFIGTRRPGEKVGEVLQETRGAEAVYRFAGDELYVRATVISDRRHPNGYKPEDFESAWSQPVYKVQPLR